ncbi:DOMON domain-containing protein frrs1L [Balamuthia mandrillaris]
MEFFAAEERHEGHHEEDEGGGGHGDAPLIAQHSVVIFHGVTMLLAWGFFLNVGSIIGRYFKLPPTQVFANWFPKHAWLQATGLLLSLLSAVMIVAHIAYDQGWHGHAKGVHHWAGILLLVLAVAQPLLGLLAHRGYLRHKRSTKYHRPHRWLGRLMMLLAVVTIALGLRQLNMHVLPVDAVAWASYSILLLLAFALITFYEWNTLRRHPYFKENPLEALQRPLELEMNAIFTLDDSEEEDDDDEDNNLHKRMKGETERKKGEEERRRRHIELQDSVFVNERKRASFHRIMLFMYTGLTLFVVCFLVLYIVFSYHYL